VVQPYFAHGAKPSLSITEDLPPIQRLALTGKSKIISSRVSFLILFVLAVLLFIPIFIIAEGVIPNQYNDLQHLLNNKGYQKLSKSKKKKTTSTDGLPPSSFNNNNNNNNEEDVDSSSSSFSNVLNDLNYNEFHHQISCANFIKEKCLSHQKWTDPWSEKAYRVCSRNVTYTYTLTVMIFKRLTLHCIHI
jgi:hypothetical protein